MGYGSQYCGADQEKSLHDNHFGNVGMEAFFNLMRIATWHTVTTGAFWRQEISWCGVG